MKISFVVGLTTLAALAMKVQSASIKSQATEFNLDNINDQLLSMNQDMSSLLEKGLTEPAAKPADQKQASAPVPSPVPPTPKKEEEVAKPAEVKKVETPTPAKPQAAAKKEAPKPATAAKTPAPKKAAA